MIEQPSLTLEDIQSIWPGKPESVLEQALLYCQRYNLDPYLSHIALLYIGNKYTPYITHKGLLHVAHLTGTFAGIRHEYGTDRNGRYIDAWAARVVSGVVGEFHGRAYMGEYDQKKNVWLSHPNQMLAKCAEVLALRVAFNVGINAAEEMNDSTPDNTPTVPAPASPPPSTQQARELQPYTTNQREIDFVTYTQNNAKWNKQVWSWITGTGNKQLGLLQEEAHAALGCASLLDWPGTKEKLQGALSFVADYRDNNDNLYIAIPGCIQVRSMTDFDQGPEVLHVRAWGFYSDPDDSDPILDCTVDGAVAQAILDLSGEFTTEELAVSLATVTLTAPLPGERPEIALMYAYMRNNADDDDLAPEIIVVARLADLGELSGKYPPLGENNNG